MKIFLFVFALTILSLLSLPSSSQKITGAGMLDEKGNLTSNQRKAKYLIVLKKNSDTSYEKLNYNFAGAMRTRVTYKDSLLTNINGMYADYAKSGYLSTEGNYFNGKKEGTWYVFDDTAKVITEYKYHLDSLISVVDMDSLENERKKVIQDTALQFEAEYNGGDAAFIKFVYSTIQLPDRTLALIRSGTVRIKFVVDEQGKTTDIEVLRSVEFALDEECMRVIALSKKWTPASDKGKKVKAYRIQPITVSVQDR